MNQDSKSNLAKRTEKFVKDFFHFWHPGQRKKIQENDAAIGTAIIFEKFRAAVEYHEDHLIFKNAISRIVRRIVTLNPSISSKDLLNLVSSELVWANFIQPKTLKSDIWEKVEKIIERYLSMITNLPSDIVKKTEDIKLLSDFMACEIEESFFPNEQEAVFIDFIGDSLAGYFNDDEIKISAKDHITQIRLAIYTIIFKPDHNLLKYRALTLIDTEWTKRQITDLKKLAKHIDIFYQKIDQQIHHPYHNRYLTAFKNISSPYSIFLNALMSGKYTEGKIKEEPEMFFEYCMITYDSMKRQSRTTVWRGVYRALLFLFLTKLILAFIVEVPVDRWLHGAIIWPVLLINILTPPVLMLLSGLTIPSINPKNDKLVRDSIKELVFYGKLTVSPFNLAFPVQRKSDLWFKYLLYMFSLALVIAAIWLLLTINFNFVSIILFFIFISAVSFLSFRIRSGSRELAMVKTKEDSVTSVVELIFIPFVRIGKKMSEQLTAHNPMLFALDFLIEAPLKTLIRFLRSWFNFISKKKEEMEIG